MNHSSPFIAPQQRPAWQQLQQLASQGSLQLHQLLNPANGAAERSRLFQAAAAGIRLDYSHQRINSAVLAQLLQLAQESNWLQQARQMFAGEAINATEQRQVLHMALRGSSQPNPPWGEAITQQVQHELNRFCDFAEHVRQGRMKGFDQQPITDVVNIGIGGSDLGPRMATEALCQPGSDRAAPVVRVHYVSNVDAWSLHNTLQPLRPQQTAFIIQSKTFTTQETLTIAASARRWLSDAGCPPQLIGGHFMAVTAQPQLAIQYGIADTQVFRFWDWVGGRYSLWSAIGLPLAIAIGAEPFKMLLDGGHAMDRHFIETPAQHNLPLLMALLGIWNGNFLNAHSHHLAAYDFRLQKFTPFIQQMEMESNGKHTHLNGDVASIQTAPVIWGGLGIDGQHAYFQLIHQGTHLVPVDFIGIQNNECPLPLAPMHQQVNHNNLQAQAKALALGRNTQDTLEMLLQSGLSEQQAAQLAPHRSFVGNIPSSTLWLETLNPFSLGALIALYEHKVFCQAAIWGINAYDQWGVELGKTMVKAMEQAQHV